jgi:hypothetical protein
MIELKGSEIRMRVLDPKGFEKFRRKDIGVKGKLAIIVGFDGRGWKTQAYRFSLPDYSSVTDVLHDANTIKGVTQLDKDRIASLTRKYFRSING